MAKSRKTKPSFDEPANAAGTGNTSWVYRTDTTAAPAAPAARPAPPAKAAPAPAASTAVVVAAPRLPAARRPAPSAPVPAQEIVDRHALYAAAAGLVPMPLVDIAAIGGVQLSMIRALTRHFHVPFDGNRAKLLIAGLSGGALATAGGRSAITLLMKFVPVAGTVIGVATVPAAASAATQAIGRACITHFSAGGSLDDLDLRKSILSSRTGSRP